jgi:hypothetical protein
MGKRGDVSNDENRKEGEEAGKQEGLLEGLESRRTGTLWTLFHAQGPCMVPFRPMLSVGSCLSVGGRDN